MAARWINLAALRATVNHGARLVLWEQLRVPGGRLTCLVSLYYIGRFKYADRLLVLRWPLTLVLEASHLADDLLRFLHTQDHITRLYSDGRL